MGLDTLHGVTAVFTSGIGRVNAQRVCTFASQEIPKSPNSFGILVYPPFYSYRY